MSVAPSYRTFLATGDDRIVITNNARNTNIITVLSDSFQVFRYFAQQASYIKYECLCEVRRSFADRIKPRATCLITSHRDAGVFHTTLREKPTHETYSYFPSYQFALFVSSKSERKEFRSKTRFVVRKTRAWPNLMLSSVKQNVIRYKKKVKNKSGYREIRSLLENAEMSSGLRVATRETTILPKGCRPFRNGVRTTGIVLYSQWPAL